MKTFHFNVLGNGPHQINECVEKANYLEFVEYYIEFITSYLNEENE